MHILLLGGSNAGVKNGWAAQFAELATGHRVENRFLGAVGSLYGLMALMKLEREHAPLPDLVIFEYCLNDILLLEAGVLRPALVADALQAVTDFCAHKGVGLFFLNLEPRPSGNRKQQKAIRRIAKLYAATARRRGVPSLSLRNVFSEALVAAHFQDENHLSTEAAGRVARALLAEVDAGVAAPQPRAEQAPRFDYVDATQTLVLGPCALRVLASRVFEGPFLEIERGGKSFWPGEGSLVALMLQSTDASGVYSIRTGDCAVRKTPRSQMQDIVRNLMLLHYVAGDIQANGEVEIAMPEDEDGLMRLPANKGLLEAPARAPFEAQTIAIHGVIFWREGSLRARLRAFVERWI
ncbi:SGNH/GDSL hydrolase family protein [Methylocystis sp. JAN1]|uniref:SGNH/GDSL hydrolase family protein n=1 Tax=Methylocystis sp. JAN1 TaxID=3397211 RepID=UPI003FA2266E